MFKKIMGIFFLLCNCSTLMGQIKVGQEFPNHEFIQLINADLKAKKLSDLKGKLVILDTWNRDCSGCIDGIPKMQSLQDKFGDSIQVILVNTYSKARGETKENALAIIRRIEKRIGLRISLPSTLNDNSLDLVIDGPQKIPNGSGEQIWIDSSGTVIHVTSESDVNEFNIRKVLKGEKIVLPTAIEHLPNFSIGNLNMPISFDDGNLMKGDSDICSHIELVQGTTKALGSAGPISEWKPNLVDKNLYHGKLVCNTNFINLYRDAYPSVFSINYFPKLRYRLHNKRLNEAFEMKVPFKNGRDQNFFSYDIYSSQAINKGNLVKRLRDALESTYGNIYFSKIKIPNTYIVFKTNPRIRVLFSKGGEPEDTFSPWNSSNIYSKRKYIKNCNIISLLDFIAQKYKVKNWSTDVIDETNLKRNIDFILPNEVKLNTRKEIVAYFKSVGIEISEITKSVDGLLITDEVPRNSKSIKKK